MRPCILGFQGMSEKHAVFTSMKELAFGDDQGAIKPGLSLVFNYGNRLGEVDDTHTVLRMATLGLMLFVKGEMLALTVHHPMYPQDMLDAQTPAIETVITRDYAEVEVESEDSDDSDDIYFFSATRTGMNPEPDSSTRLTSTFERVTCIEEVVPRLSVSEHSVPQPQLYDSSAILPPLLRSLKHIGEVKYCPDMRDQGRLDWSLLSLTDEAYEHYRSSSAINMVHIGERMYLVGEIPGIPASGARVRLLTSTRSHLKGRLIGSPMKMWLPGQHSHLTVFPITMDTPVKIGYCGSAVVSDPDDNTRQYLDGSVFWYGHLVAANSQVTIAYMIVAESIVSDIARVLKIQRSDVHLGYMKSASKQPVFPDFTVDSYVPLPTPQPPLDMPAHDSSLPQDQQDSEDRSRAIPDSRLEEPFRAGRSSGVARRDFIHTALERFRRDFEQLPDPSEEDLDNFEKFKSRERELRQSIMVPDDVDLETQHRLGNPWNQNESPAIVAVRQAQQKKKSRGTGDRR